MESTTKTENKITEFNPTVYPFRLWVALNATPQEVIDSFYCFDGNSGTVSNFIEDDFARIDVAATTYCVCSKQNNYIGAFVNIVRKDKCTVGVIAHEASHACDILSDRLGLVGELNNHFANGEARAYFIEWAAECIQSVKNNKKNKII